ncbi:hypothetical protein [Nocardioides campestrisoli]|uniref:hypothetical protein n=1 Tax=Nocardioides campestrisoli TaxID=2736757 RepID=UPI0015E7A249|nr:hypothetical protein [Nocardioides campestrisoli]
MTTGQFPGSSDDDRSDTRATATGSAPDSQGDSGMSAQAQHVAGTAGEQAKHVAGTAKDEAANVAAEAKNQASALFSEATSQLDEQSRAQKDRLAETLNTFGEDLASMASESTGLAADVAQEVAQRARSLAARLQDKSPQDLLDEVRNYARRSPGTFLLGALGAGLVAGRVARGTKAARDEQGSSSTQVPAAGGASSDYTTDSAVGYSTGTPHVPGTEETSGSGTAPTYGAPGVTAPSGTGQGTEEAPFPMPPATGPETSRPGTLP